MTSSPRTLWRRYRQSSWPRREVVNFGFFLLLGLVLIPAAIYLVGMRLLGPYQNGGYLKFIVDIASGVADGSWPFYLLVFGPYLGFWALRLFRRAWR